ncbi:MAG: hypothetical protein K6F53_03005 [Lachnospiraceae bacterium]|nr:hypothetical protein [Lachnospiraceae bacterium]
MDDNGAKKKKSPLRALWALLIIPATVLIDYLLVIVGAIIDVSIYEPKEGMVGSPVPFFSVIFILIAIVFSIIALIVMIVLIITLAVGAKKEKEYPYE